MNHGCSRVSLASVVVAISVVAAHAPAARGQTAEQQVGGLLQQAQQAYEQFLDIGAAQNHVDQAIRIVQQQRLGGNTAALAYALRGVIHVWMGEETKAVQMFVSALGLNPNVVVPQAWGGPDIDAVIRQARQRVPPPPPPTCPPGTVLQTDGTCRPPMAPTCPPGTVLQPNGTCAPPMAPTCPPGTVLQPNGTCAAPMPTCPPGTVLQPNGTCAAPAPTCPPGTVLQPNGTCGPPAPVMPVMRHTPVAEQLWNHPVPIYVDVNPSVRIGGVFAFFRAPGDVAYQRREMGRAGAGYYVEIPCTILQPQSFDYYIMVADPSGSPLAFEGSQEQPHRVMMVQTIRGLFPTRPDGSQAPDCGPDGTGRGSECPPGIPCGGVACERSCTFNDDCLSHEICLAGCCKAREIDVSGDGSTTDRIGLFLQLNAGVGLGIATGTAKEPRWYTDPLTGERLHGPDGNQPGGQQQVPIATGFAFSGGAVRIGLGYFIIPELAVSANFRTNFPFGNDFPWLVEGRLSYFLLSGPEHHLGVFLGGGAGLITHMIFPVTFIDEGCRNGDLTGPEGIPDGQCDDRPDIPLSDGQKKYEPFYKLSGMGTFAFGGTYLYMVTDMIGVGGDLGMNIMFAGTPGFFSFNIDAAFAFALMF